MSLPTPGQFPKIRMRRVRRTNALRRLLAENELSAADLIYPVFVLEGKGREEQVPSMPGISRKSLDGIMDDVREAEQLGIPAVALFPVIDDARKSLDGAECANPDGLMQKRFASINDLPINASQRRL